MNHNKWINRRKWKYLVFVQSFLFQGYIIFKIFEIFNLNFLHYAEYEDTSRGEPKCYQSEQHLCTSGPAQYVCTVQVRGSNQVSSIIQLRSYCTRRVAISPWTNRPCVICDFQKLGICQDLPWSGLIWFNCKKPNLTNPKTLSHWDHE